MKDFITLHPKFGLAPTIPLCPFCGQPKNEIVLLGNGWKGTSEPPMHSHLLGDLTPCPACEEKLSSHEWVAFIGECGHNGLIHTNSLRAMITEDEIYEKIVSKKGFRTDKCPLCLGLIKEEE